MLTLLYLLEITHAMKKVSLILYTTLSLLSLPLYFLMGSFSSNLIVLSAGFLIGIYLLVEGSDYFVDGASSVAARRHISQHIIGLTLVALATSLPEFAVSVMASAYNHPETSWGNVVGSNIANIGLVLGSAAILMPLALSKHVVKDATVLLGATVLLLIFSLFFASIFWWMGLIFLLIYALYLFEIFGREEEHEEKLEVEFSPFISWAMILLGVFGVVWGAKMVITSAVNIARIMNVPEIVIAITAIAIGTSLPELVTSVTAALKKRYGIAVGNVIGSNVFNILMVLGVASLIHPITVDKGDMVVNSAFLLAFTAAIFLLCLRGKIGKAAGAFLLSLYALFILTLVI